MKTIPGHKTHWCSHVQIENVFRDDFLRKIRHFGTYTQDLYFKLSKWSFRRKINLSLLIC